MMSSARRRPGTSPSFWRKYHQCPIHHRRAFDTDGPSRDCSSAERSECDRGIREDKETGVGAFRQCEFAAALVFAAILNGVKIPVFARPHIS